MGLGIKRYFNRHKHQAVEALPLFAPGSAGAGILFELTLQSANAVFPLLVNLLEDVGRPALAPISADEFSKVPTEVSERLAALFEAYGSDKASHRYHPVYASILQPEVTSCVVEVGLGTNFEDVPSNMTRTGRPGASLRAFREFLPAARIVGADIDRRILFAEDRIETVWVDQTDAASFAGLSDVAPIFDVLIDDGLHSPNANLGVLLYGLQRMRPGAWTVIEDIVPAALPFWQVVDALLPPDFERHIIQAATSLMFAVQRRNAHDQGIDRP